MLTLLEKCVFWYTHTHRGGVTPKSQQLVPSHAAGMEPMGQWLSQPDTCVTPLYYILAVFALLCSLEVFLFLNKHTENRLNSDPFCCAIACQKNIDVKLPWRGSKLDCCLAYLAFLPVQT